MSTEDEKKKHEQKDDSSSAEKEEKAEERLAEEKEAPSEKPADVPQSAKTSEPAKSEKKDADDDEISIDFSKLTGMFKKKKQPEQPQQTTSENKKEEPIEKKPSETTESKKDDEEITIDLGFVKKMFKSDEKKPQTAPSEKKSADPDNEDISIDFSKVKGMFSKEKVKGVFKRSETEKTESKEDDVNLDFKKIWAFIVRHRVLLLVLIPIFIAIFFRIQPAYLPITDNWATDSVVNNIQNQIRGQINQQYPNLPQQNRDVLVDQEFQRLLAEQRTQIDQQVEATSNFFKSRLQDDSGQTYLLAIDPYFWMRHARNVLNNGHPGDEIRDGIPWDTHMYAPDGRGIPTDMFHAYFIAYLFKFITIFNSDANLMTVTFYTPVLLSALAVIPAFFITRRIAGNVGGLIAGLMVAVHPAFLTRTAGGFADTDAYNVLFPLFITWLFLLALDAKDLKRNIAYSVGAGLLVALYSVSWGGWWYIFDFILGSAVAYIGYYSFVHKKELFQGGLKSFLKQPAIKNSLVFLVLFVFVAGFVASSMVSFGHFTKFVTSPGGFAKLKEVGITTIWPNVFTTVAEQNPASLNNVINQVSVGKFYFLFIALMGVFITLTRRSKLDYWFIGGAAAYYLVIFFMNVQDLNTFLFLISIPIALRIAVALWKSDTQIDIKYAIILVVWFLTTIYASTKGIRFTLLVVPAFAIGFGVALGTLYSISNSLITRSLHINKWIAKAAMVLVVFVIAGMIPVPSSPFCVGDTCQSAWNTVSNEIPSFTDAWAISLDRIKQDSEPNAIINSWWDFGHWFKFWGERPVTFDGTSQNTPQAHWIGRVLLEKDEDLAVGILRMLDCSGRASSGGSEAFTTLLDLTKDQVTAIDIMYQIMPLGKEGARTALLERFSTEEVDTVLQYTHCEPPQNYFITSEDMVGKSGVWAHFGSWDFERALIYNTLKKPEYEADRDLSVSFLQERFDYTESEADDLYFEVLGITTSDQANTWIAPWPGYAGVIGCNRDGDDGLRCDNGVQVNLTTHDAFIDSPQGTLHPKEVSFMTDDDVIVKEYEESLITINNGRHLGMALVKDGDNYRAVQMDSDLAGSMFTRMFYQDGRGLEHFDKFSDEQSVFGSRILVWKVDWSGASKNVIAPPAEPIPEPEVIEEDTMVEEGDEEPGESEVDSGDLENSDENATNN